MAEFVVNLTLIIAVLVLLVVWAVSASRRRGRDRREHARDRHLILGAFTAAARGAPDAEQDVDADVDRHSQVELDEVPADRGRLQHLSRTGARGFTTTTAQRLDHDSIIALLDLLENRKPARRGMFASLFTSPGSAWSAGIRAGRSIAAKTVSGPGTRGRDEDATRVQLYREAAAELIDIYLHNPANARDQYANYAAALGDSALAELYVSSAAHATLADHDEVAHVVDNISRGVCRPA